jgi:Flp pilus assembly protein TadD
MLRTRTHRLAATLGAAAVLALPVAAHAQLDAAQIRGSVIDEKGAPLPGVAVEMKFKGESRVPIVKTATTDKKGGFVRVGLKGGNWTLSFTKEGYKPTGIDTYLSIGGISEIPPVTMNPAPVAPPAGATAAQVMSTQEIAKQLGAAYAKALAALQAGQSAEAETQFKALTEALPNLAEAHYNLGYLYEKRGAAAEAEGEYRRAAELQPENPEATIALATIVDKGGRTEEALKVLSEAAPRFPENGRFQFALGAAAFNQGRNAEAEPAFEKAVKLDPDNAESLFFLGSIALGRNDVPTALDRLKAFVAKAPASSPNMETAKTLLATLGKKK